MQKIMFNDPYGLTQAVIEGRKTMTRRIEGGVQFQEMAACADQIFYNKDEGTLDMRYEGIKIFSHKTRYKVGEVVAVAQSYEQVYLQGNMDGDDAIILGLKYDPGMSNKMYVKSALMPHRIQITNIRCEWLQDIPDTNCLLEGIRYMPKINKFYFEDVHREEGFYFDNHLEAFAALIDKVSGRGTWARDPWVVVYEFKLVK